MNPHEMSDRMSARPSGRVESTRALTLGRLATAATKDHDSITKSSGRNERLSVAQLHMLKQTLTDRDLAVVDLLTTLRLASGRQIRHLLWGDSPSDARGGRRQLKKLADLRVVARLGRSIGGARAGSDGYVYALDALGQNVAGRPSQRRRPRTPGMSFVAHTVAVSECYLALRDLQASGAIELMGFSGEPECWRTYTRPGGARGYLKPDAYVVVGIGEYLDRWFLECDQDTENPGRLLRKMEEYVRYERSGREEAEYGVFPRVLWVVPTERRKGQLVRVLGELRSEHWRLFQIATTAEFSQAIRAGAGPHDWNINERRNN